LVVSLQAGKGKYTSELSEKMVVSFTLSYTTNIDKKMNELI
jgi:hypothetical protein